jgi:hypothetical protein
VSTYLKNYPTSGLESLEDLREAWKIKRLILPMDLGNVLLHEINHIMEGRQLLSLNLTFKGDTFTKILQPPTTTVSSQFYFLCFYSNHIPLITQTSILSLLSDSP